MLPTRFSTAAQPAVCGKHLLAGGQLQSGSVSGIRLLIKSWQGMQHNMPAISCTTSAMAWTPMHIFVLVQTGHNGTLAVCWGLVNMSSASGYSMTWVSCIDMT